MVCSVPPPSPKLWMFMMCLSKTPDFQVPIYLIYVPCNWRVLDQIVPEKKFFKGIHLVRQKCIPGKLGSRKREQTSGILDFSSTRLRCWNFNQFQTKSAACKSSEAHRSGISPNQAQRGVSCQKSLPVATQPHQRHRGCGKGNSKHRSFCFPDSLEW